MRGNVGGASDEAPSTVTHSSSKTQDMSLAAPKHPEELEQARAASERMRQQYMVAIVSPRGEVDDIYCPPPTNGELIGEQRGDVPVVWMDGRPRIVERWSKKGYSMFEDMCRADGMPHLIAQRREAVQLVGKVKIENPNDLYPPSVMRLRREASSGVREDKVYIPGRGLVDATDDAKAERIAGLLDAAGEGMPTAADRDAAKKAAK